MNGIFQTKKLKLIQNLVLIAVVKRPPVTAITVES